MRTLKLKARYFKDSNFESIIDCVMAKAAKEQFGIADINVSTSYIIGDDTFYKISYTYENYKEDKIIATQMKFSDEVIREVEAH